MRYLKLLTVVGLILAVTGTAGAVNIPLNQPYTGPLYMHLSNWDDSVVYDYNGGFLADNVTAIVPGTAYAAGLVAVLNPGINVNIDSSGENAWGIFRIEQIVNGELTGPNTIGAGDTELYSFGSSSTDIVGIFYGGIDQTVAFDGTNASTGGKQTIISSGQKFEIFTQPEGSYNNGGTNGVTDGASDRVLVNEYPGVGYTGAGTNTLLAGAERVLTGITQPGMEAAPFLSDFTPSGSTGSGTFATYISLTSIDPDGPGGFAAFAGTQNVEFNLNVFPFGGAVPVVAGDHSRLQAAGDDNSYGVADVQGMAGALL